jgi:hypothetical protein
MFEMMPDSRPALPLELDPPEHEQARLQALGTLIQGRVIDTAQRIRPVDAAA